MLRFTIILFVLMALPGCEALNAPHFTKPLSEKGAPYTELELDGEYHLAEPKEQQLKVFFYAKDGWIFISPSNDDFQAARKLLIEKKYDDVLSNAKLKKSLSKTYRLTDYVYFKFEHLFDVRFKSTLDGFTLAHVVVDKTKAEELKMELKNTDDIEFSITTADNGDFSATDCENALKELSTFKFKKPAPGKD